ncbi:MAG: hypothetical protein AAF798_05125 [Bacteroidota bacterium]
MKSKFTRFIFFSCTLVLFFLTTSLEAQIIYQGELKARQIRKGKGQEFSEEFRFTHQFHFIQFGVYPTDTDVETIKAPKGAGQVWLIWHPHTSIKDVNERGAIYIVKPVFSASEARAQVASLKKKGISSWYNAALNGVSFTLLGFTESIVK